MNTRSLLLTRFCTFLTGFALLLVLAPAPSQGQALNGRYVEAGVHFFDLDSGNADWRGVYLGSVLQAKGLDVWRAEAFFQQRFNDQGFLYKVEHTRHFGPRWYGQAAVGTSSGGFFHPRLRADVNIARKWLARKQWITVAGLMLYDAKDVHRDYAVLFESLWYAGTWVFQGGVRWNLSTPGDAWSRYYTASVTQGRPYRYYLSLRVGAGTEAYQIVDPLTIYTDFESRDVMFTWRQWITRGFGFNLHGMYYENPYYRRPGVQLGLFKHF